MTPPRQPILILGEAWGAEEAQIGLPFVGAAGRELNRMLEEAGIQRRDCYVTNVFNLQPPPTNGKTNDIANLCGPRGSSSVPMPELGRGNYLLDQYWPEVLRAREEILAQRPNLVIALGNTALWALTGTYGIKKLRGTITASKHPEGLKILPTYHPSYVLRDWATRPIVIADLMKAKRQSLFPDIRRPRREIWLEPSLNHIELFYRTYVLQGCTKLSVDIETAGASQITCVGFAPSPQRALVIPFVDNRKPSGSYWDSPADEVRAWELVRQFCEHPDAEFEIVGQNFLYDINWLWTKLGIRPRGFVRDTMLRHHALNPELEKGLGFLGSVYTDEPAWKTMRGKGMFTIKRGE